MTPETLIPGREDLDALARAGLTEDLWAGAAKKLEAYVREHPQDWEARVHCAKMYSRDDNCRKVIAIMEPLISQNPRISIGTLLASAYLRCNDPVAAEREVSRVMEFEPGNPVCFRFRGELQFKRGDYPAAKEDFLVRAQLEPQEASSWLDLAYTEEALGETLAAFEHLEKAITLEEPHVPWELFMRQALLAQSLGRWDAVEKILSDAIPIMGGALVLGSKSEALAERGWARYQQQKAGDLEDVEEALRLDPHNRQAGFYRGVIRTSRGDERAGKDLAIAIKLDPNFAGGHAAFAAFSLKIKGDTVAALKHYRRAVALDSSYAESLADTIRDLEQGLDQ